LLRSSLKKINTALASLELGLAEEELDFLGNLLFEDSPDFILGGDELFNTTLIFRTQEDSKVDDLICLPLQNQEFDFDDPLRPVIPDDTHPNCRCYYEDANTGINLGQDGAFASASTKRVTQEFADLVGGEEGVWKTVNGTPVFFPDGGDGKEAIDKAFKNKSTKSQKQLENEGRKENLKNLQERIDKNKAEIKPHEPVGEVVQTVDVDGHDVDVGEHEDPTDAIDDFRDKNELWEKTPDLPTDFEAKNNVNISRQGERLEDAMRQTGEWSDNPEGSVFLTRDGEWIGFGGDTDHRMSVAGAESYSGIKLEEPRPEGNSWTRSDDLDKFMRMSGTARVSVRGGINADISHPLSSAQRNALTDLAISKDYGRDDIFFDHNNLAKDIKEETLIRSILDFGSANVVIADTFEGKEGVWRTINGTPIFIPEGEDIETVITETFKKIESKSPSPQAPKGKEPQRFSEARKAHQEFKKGKGDQSYSFDPVTGKGYDAFNKEEAVQMYNRYDTSDGRDPVYFISETNHQGELSRESESAFINITNHGNDPIIGKWVDDKTGFKYTDVSFSEAGLGKKGSDRKIRDILSENAQESAMKLFPDGTVDFVNGF
jgi:hypothetical protein